MPAPRIVGTQTLGKTLAHNLARLADGSGIFFTMGELRTNLGTSLLEKGLRRRSASRRASRPRTASQHGERPLPRRCHRPAPPRQFRRPSGDGFRVSVFAAEPDVQNPIAMAWDPRGRLWIAENYTYAERTQRFDLSLRDRVLIFEDADGDGRFDRRTVFTDDVQMLTSVELGFGGAWLLCPPQLLFLPDRDGDDVPDGPAEVVLDGFSVPAENYHTFANGLKWGPDGWLYGRCGASSPGEIGAPGTPEHAPRADPRRPLAVPPSPQAVRGPRPRHDQPLGARLERPRRAVLHQHGQRPPLAHDPRRALRSPAHDRPQPAGLRSDRPARRPLALGQSKELILGAPVPATAARRRPRPQRHCRSTWATSGPRPIAGKLLTLNFHGRRVNVDRLERSGSGYVGRHEPDILFAADPWFRGIDLSYGPDGGVFILDWSDTGDCHDHDGVHRSSGRIYKVTYGDPATNGRASTWRAG